MGDQQDNGTVETEWAIRYGDGTVEEQGTEAQARGEIDYARTMVRERRDDAEAYEGAVLMSRQRTVTVTPWTLVDPKDSSE